mgnify:CR=1 FL=1
MNYLPVDIFIVFAYETFGHSNRAKHVLGIYASPHEAEQRQQLWSQEHNSHTVFINKFPYGDGNTELFTSGHGTPHEKGAPAYKSNQK